jgi:TonB family protein
MTISSKDTLEPAAPPAKSAAPSSASPAKPDMSRFRADAVSLDVPVRVHGSRLSEVAMGLTPQTEPFEEETSTMIVFPHGGVLRMAIAVSVGQMLVITNQKTKQDAICRVVKVRAYSHTQAYVEVEFTHRQFGYWGVHFSSEDTEFAAAPPIAAPPEQPSAPPVESRKPDPPVVSSVAVKVEDLARPVPLPASRPESAFIGIGSREDFQVAASTTSRLTAPAATRRESVVPPPPAPLVAPPVSRPAPLPTPLEEVAVETPRSSRVFGTLTGGSLSSPNTTDMGTRLGRGVSDSASPADSRSGKGLLIAACTAFLVVGVALGAWYFRQHPSGSQVSQRPAAAQAPASAVSTSSSFSETQNLPPANSQVAPTVNEVPAQTVSLAAGANPSRPNSARKAGDGSSEIGLHVVNEEPAPGQKSAPMGNIGVAVIGAHPVRSAKGGGNVPAPNISSLASASPWSGITASSPNLAPPPVPLQRIRVGGSLVQAKLIHSTPPVYPASARQSGIEGDVVVTAHLDQAGNVTSVGVVSGLAVLRQAAIDAVKTWKYQPSTLDGDPVQSQVNITLQFRK